MNTYESKINSYISKAENYADKYAFSQGILEPVAYCDVWNMAFHTKMRDLTKHLRTMTGGK